MEVKKMSIRETKRVTIHKALVREIELSQKALNENEQKKTQGKKKKKWTFIEASQKMGIYLNNLRRK